MVTRQKSGTEFSFPVSRAMGSPVHQTASKEQAKDSTFLAHGLESQIPGTKNIPISVCLFVMGFRELAHCLGVETLYLV